jgi:hypothetical protein
MASGNAVTLFSSVILGTAVYGERLSASGGGHVTSAAVGLVVAIFGIVLLSSAEGPPNTRLASGDGIPSPAPTTDVVARIASARRPEWSSAVSWGTLGLL